QKSIARPNQGVQFWAKRNHQDRYRDRRRWVGNLPGYAREDRHVHHRRSTPLGGGGGGRARNQSSSRRSLRDRNLWRQSDCRASFEAVQRSVGISRFSNRFVNSVTARLSRTCFVCCTVKLICTRQRL